MGWPAEVSINVGAVPCVNFCGEYGEPLGFHAPNLHVFLPFLLLTLHKPQSDPA